MLRAAGLAGAALLTLTALPGAASAAAKATFTPKIGFSVYQSYGMQQGAVRGPGGRIWLIAMMPPQWQGNPTGSQALDAVNPTTGVVNYYAPLPPSVGVRPPCSPTTTARLRSTAAGTPGWSRPRPRSPAPGRTTWSATPRARARATPTRSPPRARPGGITSAGDGSVWVNCGKNKIIRVTAAAKSRTFSLSRVSSVGHFAACPSGSMWAVGYNAAHAAIGLVRVNSGGGEAYYATPRGITPRGLAGDGSSRVIETATCSARMLPGVGLDQRQAFPRGHGARHRASQLGPFHGRQGNVWLLVDGSAAKAGQQFFLRLTSGNKIQTYAFAVPGCGGSLLTAAGNPAGSADGSAWIESTSTAPASATQPPPT